MFRPLSLLGVVYFLTASVCLAQEGKLVVRLALVSSSPSETSSKLLDLTLAKLSNVPNFELLERTAISRILQEQKLSLAGLVDAGTAVAAGKFLAADLFAQVETDQVGKETIGLVIYDTGTGIRLHDTVLPSSGLEQQADEVAAAIRLARQKYTLGFRGLRTVCILGTRNADLPRSMDHIGQAVSFLLGRHLTTSPSLTVLERKRLDWVNKEKNLTSTNKELLASLVMVDVEISRAEKGIKATVHLTDSQGKDLGKIKAESKTANPEELVKGLLAGMVHSLQAAPTGVAPNRLRESQRFFLEGQRLVSHKHWQPAIQTLEAAYTLDRANGKIRDELAKILIGWGEWTLPRQYKSLPAQRGIPKPELVKQVLVGGARGYELRLLSLENTPARFEDMEKYRSTFLLTQYQLSYFNPSQFPQELIDEDRELRHQVFAAFVQLGDKELDQWAQVMGQTTSIWGVGYYMSQLACFLGEIKNAKFFTAQEQDTIALSWLTRWSEAIQTPGLNVDWQVNSLFQQPFDRDLRFVPIYEKLTRHSSPLIQLWGRYLLINVRRNNGLLMPAQAELAYQECKQKALEVIEKLPLSSKTLGAFDLQVDFRFNCYTFLVQTNHFRNAGDAEARCREKFAICELMLRRRELVINIFLDALYRDPYSKDSFPNERLKLIKEAQGVLAQGTPALCGNPAFMQVVLARIQEEILRERPDLVRDQPKSTAPNIFKEMRLLLRPEEIPDLRGMGPPTLRGDYIFVPIHRQNPQDASSDVLLEVLQVPWKQKGNWKKWGQWKLPGRLPGERSLFGILASCWGEDRLFVGTQFGLFVFAPDGTVQPVHKDFDLPVPATQAMTYHNGKIYAYQQGGYFVALDLKTKKYETLASSRRRERLSPFDDSDIFHMHGLVVDPPRDRLLIILSQRPSVMEFYPAGKYPDSTNGLWEYNFKTKKFARIVELYYKRLTHISALEPGHLLLSPSGIVDFDMKTHQAEILFAPGKMGPSLARLDAPLIQPAAVLRPDFLYFWKHDRYLWGVSSFNLAKVSLQDGRVEILPGFDAPFTRHLTYAWKALERISSHHLVMQNNTGLWLLELPE